MQLTQDEIRLLRQLSRGPQTIAGSRPRDGLRRLVDAGWASERSQKVFVTEYQITDAGRAFLKSQVSDHSIPVEELNASNDE
jgi:hypothetical protein